MAEFGHTTADVAAWNLAGFQPISAQRLARQVEGFAILDAELITLVEVKPFSHMQDLQDPRFAAAAAPWKVSCCRFLRIEE